jgi:hypothetical protein
MFPIKGGKGSELHHITRGGSQVPAPPEFSPVENIQQCRIFDSISFVFYVFKSGLSRLNPGQPSDPMLTLRRILTLNFKLLIFNPNCLLKIIYLPLLVQDVWPLEQLTAGIFSIKSVYLLVVVGLRLKAKRGDFHTIVVVSTIVVLSAVHPDPDLTRVEIRIRKWWPELGSGANPNYK